MVQVNKLTGPSLFGGKTPTAQNIPRDQISQANPAPIQSSPNAVPAGVERPEQSKQHMVVTAADVGTVPADLIGSNPQPAPGFANGINAQLASVQKNQGNSALAINLPDYLCGEMPETVEAFSSGYIGFASSQSPKWPQMVNAGLQEGQPFAFIDRQYYGMPSVNFFLCRAESFQSCLAGKQGNMLFVTRDIETKFKDIYDPRSKQSFRVEPHYVGLLIVDIGGTLYPIKGDFRGTKSGGMGGAIAAVKAAADPQWLSLSEQHRATAAFPQPFGRVWNILTTKYEVGKSSGNDYYRSLCVSQPAPVSFMQKLVASFGDEEFRAKLDEANINYEARIKFLDDWMVAAAAKANNPNQNQNQNPANSQPSVF